MYDPEYSLELARQLAEDQVRLAKVEARCGMAHPWTQRVALVTEILESIAQKEDELMNCWDEEQQIAIDSEIGELLTIARQAIEK